MNLETFRLMAEYHAWANDRLLKLVEGLPAEQFTRDLGGSFPSLQALYAHMLRVDAAWLERFSGEPLPKPEKAEIPDAAAARGLLQMLAGKTQAYVSRLPEDQLDRVIAFRGRDGTDYALALRECLTHLFNHGTYHRGQVANYLRQLGAEAASTDLIRFIRERRQ